MSLRLICGRAGTGKSEFCFNEISEKINNNNKIYIITPEQYSYTAEKKLLNSIKTEAVFNAEVLTFNRMAYRVSNEVGDVTKKHLSKSGKAMMIYDIILQAKNNLKFLGKTSQNVELIDTQLTELKKHKITLEDLKNSLDIIEDRYLQEKLKDMINIYELYEQSLEENTYIDEEATLDILASQLEETNLFQDAIFYIDEFIGFTKQEYYIIEKLLKVASNITITINTPNLDMRINENKDVFYFNKQTADKLLYIAKNNKIECEKTIFLEENYRLKNPELLHLEKNIEEIPYKIYKNEVKNIKLFLARNPYSEIEDIAKNINILVKEKNYRYRDISIITKDLEKYSNICKAIFQKYDIPIFIDEKKELSQNLFIKYIISLLNVFSKNWSYESIIEYVKTSFLDIDEDDIYLFENYTRKWGIKGSKWYKGEWKFEEITEKNKEEIKKISEARSKIVQPLYKLKENLAGIKTVEQITKELYKFLIENKVDEVLKKKQEELNKNGNIELAKEQELAWNLIIQLLDEIVLLFQNKNITFEKYRELLKIGLQNNGLGKIPQTQDQLIIGDVDRTKNHKVKAVFILGMNDGIFPKINRQEGFLNDTDRENLKLQGIELAKGTLDKLYEDNFNIYKAFSIAEEKLYLSYVSSNMEGASLRPSIYINKIKKIFPNLKEQSDLVEDNIEITNETATFEELIHQLKKYQEGIRIEEIWYVIFNYYYNNPNWKDKLKNSINAINNTNEPEKISKENIDKIYGDTLHTSISRLEKYKSCPFSYHLKYGLKLMEKDNYKMQSIDTGSFMHETIDDFFHIIRERELDIKKLELEEIYIIIEEIINEKLAFTKYYIFSSSDKFKTLTKKLKRVISKSMKYIIQGLQNSDFQVYGNEVEFKKGKKYDPIRLNLENGKKVEITGKIDRIDIAKNEDGKYIRIIDYKSSVKNIDLNQVEAGMQIQLITYLDAVCNVEEVMPAGVLYFSLIDPIIKSNKQLTDEQIEEELSKKFKMQGLILADVKVVKMMDKTLELGQSKLVPAYIDKEGKISTSKSSAINKEQFEELRKTTNKVIQEISNEILDGNISINPYYNQKTKKLPCEYCEYKSICQFK